MEPIYPNSQDNCTPSCDEFDSRFSTRSLRMLKLLTPLLPSAIQPAIAMAIRLQELQVTLRLLRSDHFSRGLLHAADIGSHKFSTETVKLILEKISPLLTPDEKKEIDKIKQMLQMFETYKQLEPYMSMFSQMASACGTGETSKDTDSDCGNKGREAFANSAFGETLAQMLNPDMLNMLGFNAGNNSENNTGSNAGNNIGNMLNPDMLQTISGLMHAFSDSSPGSAEGDGDIKEADIGRQESPNTDSQENDLNQESADNYSQKGEPL